MIKITNIDGLSKSGNRENNEDYIIFARPNLSESRFIILCDGMGGHGHGEVASSSVANSFLGYLKELNKEEYTENDLQESLDYAISCLTSENTFDDERPMGTTVVVAVINKMNILVGHVGDSRCYLFDENGIIKFRTKDHSKIQEAIDAEILTPEEAFNNVHKNLLTRCIMSGKTDVKIDVDTLMVENGDRLLLCSDGVNDCMRDSDISASLINRDIQGVLEVIDLECEANSKDNYSVILADLKQDEVNSIPSEKKKFDDNSIEVITICCPKCGVHNNADAIYCKSCGDKIKGKEISDTDENIYCDKKFVCFTLDQVRNKIRNINWGKIIKGFK